MYYPQNMPPGSCGLQVHSLNYPLNVASQPYQDVQEVVVP